MMAEAPKVSSSLSLKNESSKGSAVVVVAAVASSAVSASMFHKSSKKFILPRLTLAMASTLLA